MENKKDALRSILTTSLGKYRYLRILLENRQKSNVQSLREIHTDDSYIDHHRRHIHQDSFHSSVSNQTEKPPHKGMRVCFAAVIDGSGV